MGTQPAEIHDTSGTLGAAGSSALRTRQQPEKTWDSYSRAGTGWALRQSPSWGGGWDRGTSFSRFAKALRFFHAKPRPPKEPNI